ncbi:hypothetical protein E3Q12_04087 [Wallemia mellicola]|nr:hypothetical protein E3Q12_04087 [Wallemia mellicola]
MSLNNLNEIRILMVSIVGGSWNPVDVSNVFNHAKARNAVLVCLPIYEEDYPYCNFYLTDLFLRQTSPQAITNSELDAILTSHTSRNSSQNVLAHILVKVERPKSVTNTDTTLPLSLRPGRQPRPPSSAGRRSTSGGNSRLDDFGAPITSPSVEKEQHALLSKFEQEQRDHELAQKLQEDLRIEDERAREEHNRKIERQQRQWAEQVAGCEMPHSEVDLARRRHRERERLLLLRERERLQQQQQQTERKTFSSYPADQRRLQKSSRHSPYPAPQNIPMTSPAWNTRPPITTSKQSAYTRAYHNQRPAQFPTTPGVPSIPPPTRQTALKNQSSLQTARSMGNIYENYHNQENSKVFPAVLPNVSAGYVKQGKSKAPVYVSSQQPQITSAVAQRSIYSPTNSYPVHQATLTNHPSHPPAVEPSNASPYSNNARAPTRPYSEEELNWLYRMNQQIDEQQIRSQNSSQQPYVSSPNSAILVSPGYNGSNLASSNNPTQYLTTSPNSDHSSRSPSANDGLYITGIPKPRQANNRAYSSTNKMRPLSVEDNTIDKYYQDESVLATSAPANHPKISSFSDQQNSPQAEHEPRTIYRNHHNQDSSISSIPDERTSSSNRSSATSVDPLTPASDINSPAYQDRLISEEDQEFLLEDVTNAYFKESDNSESDYDGEVASGEDYLSTTDDDDEFGWKIKPAYQYDKTSIKSSQNATPTSPEMPTIIPSRSNTKEIEHQQHKSPSLDTVKDYNTHDSTSEDEGQATWQLPPKIISDKLHESNINNSKQEKRKLQLIIPESNVLTSEPQTTITTTTSASDSGSPAQHQLRSHKLSPNLLSRRKLHRGSSIRDKRNENALFRPNPEDLIDNLELYFPGHDLDRPIVSNDGTDEATPDNKVSSPSNEAVHTNTNDTDNFNNETEQLNTRVRRTRTIRHVAQDHRKALDRARSFKVGDDASYQSKERSSVIYEEPSELTREDTIPDTDSQNLEQQVRSMSQSNLRKSPVIDDRAGLKRRSTVFWGNKVVQVQPNERERQEQILSPVTNEPSTIKWVKGDLIGKGSFGHVYLALNANTGEPLAVKQIALTAHSDEDNDGDDKLVDSIKYEIELLKDLDHDRIVSYLGFERTDKFFSIFLEYVPGGSVMRCLRRHVYLHDRGVWHRDLKADNLLVDFEGNCKISDFGVSKAADSDAYGTNAGATNMKGTFYWMAPEVIDSVGMAGYSAKCDIWSLGCVLLEMLTAERPWPKMTMVQIVMEVGQKRSAPPVKEGIEMSQDAIAFKNACFKAEPRERPTASQLADDKFLTIDKEWNFKDSRLGQTIRSTNRLHSS